MAIRIYKTKPFFEVINSMMGLNFGRFIISFDWQPKKRFQIDFLESFSLTTLRASVQKICDCHLSGGGMLFF